MDVTAPIGSYLTPAYAHARVRDAMRPRVLVCDPATPLVTAAQRMSGEHVHALLVLTPSAAGYEAAGARPWSVLTDRDLLRSADRVEELTAGEAASGAALEVRADDLLTDAAQQMLDHGSAHAIVVDDATGRPVGVVSTLDIAGILGWGRG